MKRICPSRIVLAEGARETVSLRGMLSTRFFFFFFSNKRLYDIHVTRFLHSECDSAPHYSFFHLLTSFCPICSHIFKTLNTISTTSVCCNHTISTICVVFTQYAVNYHVSKMLTFSYHTSLPKTKIMDLLVIFTNA